MKRSKTIGEMIPKDELSYPEKERRAQEHDEVIVNAIRESAVPFQRLCRELVIMRDEKLWKFIKNPEGNGDNRGCFASWREYAHFRLGPMCQASLYEHVNSAMLTMGANALSESEVQELGPKKCNLISQLPSEQWREVAEKAKTSRVAQVKDLVDIRLGKETEAKVETKRVDYSDMPQEVIELIAEVEKDGIYLNFVRDNDRTWTLRAKLWHAVFYHFKQEYAADFIEAKQYREQKEAVNA